MVRKFLAIVGLAAGAIALSGCALFDKERDVGVEWGKAQSVYNSVLNELIVLREPCVQTAVHPEYGPDHAQCFLKDDLYRKVDHFRIIADGYLKAADTAIQSEDARAEVYLDAATGAITALIRYRGETGAPLPEITLDRLE